MPDQESTTESKLQFRDLFNRTAYIFLDPKASQTLLKFLSKIFARVVFCQPSNLISPVLLAIEFGIRNYLRDKVEDERPNISFVSVVHNNAKGRVHIWRCPTIKDNVNSTQLADTLKIENFES